MQVSGKKDLSDFYRNLLKHNVAFGAGKEKDMRREEAGEEEAEEPAAGPETSSSKPDQQKNASDNVDRRNNTAQRRHRDQDSDSDSASPFASPKRNSLVDHPAQENPHKVSVINTETTFSANAEQNPLHTGPPEVHGVPPSAPAGDKGSKEDAVAAARERYLARKKQRKD